MSSRSWYRVTTALRMGWLPALWLMLVVLTARTGSGPWLLVLALVSYASVEGMTPWTRRDSVREKRQHYTRSDAQRCYERLEATGLYEHLDQPGAAMRYDMIVVKSKGEGTYADLSADHWQMIARILGPVSLDSLIQYDQTWEPTPPPEHPYPRPELPTPWPPAMPAPHLALEAVENLSDRDLRRPIAVAAAVTVAAIVAVGLWLPDVNPLVGLLVLGVVLTPAWLVRAYKLTWEQRRWDAEFALHVLRQSGLYDDLPVQAPLYDLHALLNGWRPTYLDLDTPTSNPFVDSGTALAKQVLFSLGATDRTKVTVTARQLRWILGAPPAAPGA